MSEVPGGYFNSIGGVPSRRAVLKLAKAFSEEVPIELAGLTGVWCMSGLLEGHLASLTIIETARRRARSASTLAAP